jgi:hypothetical protein
VPCSPQELAAQYAGVGPQALVQLLQQILAAKQACGLPGSQVCLAAALHSAEQQLAT